MAKLSLTLAAAAFLLFLVATEATIRTTVIIDEDASNQRGKGQGQGGECREQIERQQNLWHCQQHIIQQAQSQRGDRGRRDDFYEEFEINQQGQEHFDDCCQQLRQLDRQCTCQGLEQAVGQIPRGQIREQDRQTIWQIAENLPSQCRTETTSCHFGRRQAAWF